LKQGLHSNTRGTNSQCLSEYSSLSTRSPAVNLEVHNLARWFLNRSERLASNENSRLHISVTPSTNTTMDQIQSRKAHPPLVYANQGAQVFSHRGWSFLLGHSLADLLGPPSVFSVFQVFRLSDSSNAPTWAATFYRQRKIYVYLHRNGKNPIYMRHPSYLCFNETVKYRWTFLYLGHLSLDQIKPWH
jgi:hypothetical protein